MLQSYASSPSKNARAISRSQIIVVTFDEGRKRDRPFFLGEAGEPMPWGRAYFAPLKIPGMVRASKKAKILGKNGMTD